MQVEVIDLNGKSRTHPIRRLRKATDKEMLALHFKLGPVLAERMQTFFPVVVHSTGEGRECIDILWIDHTAPTTDQHLL